MLGAQDVSPNIVLVRRRPRPRPRRRRRRRRRCINSRGHGIVSGIPYRLERGHGPFGMREHRLVTRQGWLFPPFSNLY